MTMNGSTVSVFNSNILVLAQLHRRLLFDDGFGVGEPLNESAYGQGLVARGKHWIYFAGDKTGEVNKTVNFFG